MAGRLDKVNALLKKEISEIIKREAEWPPGVLVTVMEARTSADLVYTTVYLSVLPREKEKEVLEILRERIYDIQGVLNRKLVMKVVPRVSFKLYPLGRKEDLIQKLIEESREED